MTLSLLKILIVEDDEDDYFMTRQFLTKIRGKRYDLIWASTYEEGLRLFAQADFSAALVDYSLGEQNGLDFIREAAALDRAVPIIFMTGQGNYDIDLQAMQAGAVDYLTKGDINAALLERSIRYAIERKETERKLRQDAARFELLANLSHDFVEAGLDYRKLLHTITRRIAETLGDGSIIHILQEDQQTLEPVAAYHPDPAARAMLVKLLSTAPLRVGEGLAGEVALVQKPKYVCEMPTGGLASQAPVELAPWLQQYPVDSLYAAPLCSHAQLIGTLQIVRARPGSSITPEEQSFYYDLAARAALAIDNARLHMEVEHLAVTDALTGLFNRRGFFQHGEIEVGRFRRYGHPLSVIMLDIDHFKSINDTFGHAFGDEVLRALGHKCSAHVRQMDIVSRLGGDEFIILLPETSLETAYAIAKRIHDCFGETQFSTPAGLVQLSASFGVTAAREDTKSLESLISRADQALYEAKQKGRNQVQAV